MKSKLGTVLILVGIMLTGAGIAFGNAGVNVIASTSCGNTFTVANEVEFTDTGSDACAVARSERKPWTAALITAGLLGIILGAGDKARETWAPEPHESNAVDDLV
jgi:hypothetical protein